MKKILLFLSVLCTALILSGCNTTTTEIKMNVTYETFTIMEDTVYETTGYIIKSNYSGSKFAIVGGIHGDETSGWQAALELKDKMINNEYYFKGEVLIIPKANILGCNVNLRRPDPNNEAGNYANPSNNEAYNLNRVFPGKSLNDGGNLTEQLAYAITTKLNEFNARLFVDLHESNKSHNEATSSEQTEWLGETIIYGNYKSMAAASRILANYNSNLSSNNVIEFGETNNPKVGSFNYYFCGKYYNANTSNDLVNTTDLYMKSKSYYSGNNYALTYTIETTRGNAQALKIREHLAMLKYIFSEYGVI